MKMNVHISLNGNAYRANLNNPYDISIPLRAGTENVNAWYCEPVEIEPVKTKDWIGDVNQGGAVNFRNVFFNPHGNGTHTECVGHISKENYSLNQCLTKFNFIASLVTVSPEEQHGDYVITKSLIEPSITNGTEALIIRTLPNDDSKLTRQYSNTNPPFMDPDTMTWLLSIGIKHLLIDLPSVDKEKDDGKLAAHHNFWNYPGDTREDCTISEMVYIKNEIEDGLYLLNLQITSLENDASPSKPVLYKLLPT
jgi:arylformamidase